MRNLPYPLPMIDAPAEEVKILDETLLRFVDALEIFAGRGLWPWPDPSGHKESIRWMADVRPDGSMGQGMINTPALSDLRERFGEAVSPSVWFYPHEDEWERHLNVGFFPSGIEAVTPILPRASSLDEAEERLARLVSPEAHAEFVRGVREFEEPLDDLIRAGWRIERIYLADILSSPWYGGRVTNGRRVRDMLATERALLVPQITFLHPDERRLWMSVENSDSPF